MTVNLLNCILCMSFMFMYYLFIENWIFVNRSDTGCIGDCKHGTVTERYKCNAISCQGINDYVSPASKGTVEVVKRRGLCNQQTVCQSKYLFTL